jgi:putative hydroxymethylpyrimidine transport system ATP-binding protein
MKQNPAPAIHITNLNFSYKNTAIFNNLDFNLAAGEFTCLLGPSGIGKTTLLRFIANLNQDLAVNRNGNIIISDNLPITKRIAYMSQPDSLLPWLTVLDNVMLGMHLRHEQITALSKLRALELLESVNLPNSALLRPAQLSSGMRQRTALARTLFEDNDIVLMDEPFSSLDAITRYKLQDLAVKLLANRTVLLVTHDPLEALRISSCIYVMHGNPVTISQPIKPNNDAPRNLTDLSLLQQHTNLLELLGIAT